MPVETKTACARAIIMHWHFGMQNIEVHSQTIRTGQHSGYRYFHTSKTIYGVTLHFMHEMRALTIATSEVFFLRQLVRRLATESRCAGSQRRSQRNQSAVNLSAAAGVSQTKPVTERRGCRSALNTTRDTNARRHDPQHFVVELKPCRDAHIHEMQHKLVIPSEIGPTPVLCL